MNDQKCQKLYAEFVRLLREHKLDWVLTQVEEQIRIGKTAPEQLQPARGSQIEFLESEDESHTRIKRPRAERNTFLKRVDYTPQERLQLIIAATEHAVVDVGEIGLHLAAFVGQGQPPIHEVQFVSEDENIPAKPFPLIEASSRKQAIEKLRSLLSELTAEVCKHAH